MYRPAEKVDFPSRKRQEAKFFFILKKEVPDLIPKDKHSVNFSVKVFGETFCIICIEVQCPSQQFFSHIKMET